MNYEVVELKEKIVVGVCAKTSNTDPNMGMIIGGLWEKLYQGGINAKFSVHGHMERAVVKAWEEIWTMNLDRSFTGDFEEYLNCDLDNADIDIYVALR